MPQAQRTIVVDVPPEKLLEVINDFDSYPEFLPEVKKISVSNRTANSADVTYEIDVIKRIQYTVRVVNEGMTVRWSLVKGDMMKKNEGSWQLRPEGEGRTHATYSLELGLSGLIPSSITTKLAETSLPALLQNFKNRAESLARRSA